MSARLDAAAGAAGQVVPVIAGIVVVPLYLAAFGQEGYGLVSFLTSMQAIVAVFDLGMSATATRQMARRSAVGVDLATLTRTIETWYFALAGVIAVLMITAAGLLADHVLDARRLDQSEVRSAMVLLGAALAARVPVGMYSGIMRGLHRHVALNTFSSASAMARHGGGAAIAVLTESVTTTFAWFVISSVAETLVLRTLTWRSSAIAGPRRFDRGELRTMWREARAVAAVSILAVVIKQLDRIVVAASLPLASLGAYGVATTVAGALVIVPTALFTVALPRLSALLATDERRAASVYERSTAAVAIVSAPLAALLAALAVPLLETWTRSHATALAGAPALRVLAVAFGLNAMMQVPWALQLAAGDTRTQVVFNAVGAALMAPVTLVLVDRFSIAGAAGSWLAFNVAYIVIVPIAIERRVMSGLLARFVRSTSRAALAAVPAYAAAAAVVALTKDSPTEVVLLLGACVGAVAFAISFGPRRLIAEVRQVMALTSRAVPQDR